MQTQDELQKQYENFDFSKAKITEPRLIKKIRQLQQQEAEQSFDDDVLSWVVKQDETTKRHLNEVIRHFMAIKMA